MTKHLAWNEDDSDKPDKNNNRGNNSGNDGPPDLDEIFKNAQKWLNNTLGSKKNKNAFNGGGLGNDNNNFGKQGAVFGVLAAIVFVIIIAIVGFYKVEPGEQAVEYRFGQYIGTEGPGPHWIFPGIYSKEIVNTSAVYQRKFEDYLITKEVNIVSVALAVQYKIGNLEDYLFKVNNPEESLSEVTRAAIRQVIADSTLEQVLSTRGNVETSYMGDQIESLITKNLEEYQTGLDIQGVEILAVLPPTQVKEAFNDAIQAQEDEVRYQNEAEAYERKVVPVAEGKRARIVQEANAYAAQTVLAAEGDVSRFLAILPEYARAPKVTRNRLYIQALEDTLKNTPKIMVDSKANNVLVLPLDKFNLGNTISQNEAVKVSSGADLDSKDFRQVNNLRSDEKSGDMKLSRDYNSDRISRDSSRSYNRDWRN